MKILRITSGSRYPKWRALWELVNKNKLSEHSANLAYTFLFSLFPLLVILGYFVARWELSSPTASLFLQNVLPSPIYSLLESYLKSARPVDTPQVATAGALSLYSCARIALSLRQKMRRIYGLSDSHGPIGDYLVAFVFSVFLLIGLLLSLVVLVAGEWLLVALEEHIRLNGLWVRIWLLARFGFVGCFLFVLFFVLYRYLPGIPLSGRQAVPGALFGSFAWVVLSALFSFYVDNLHDYSLLYGSIGVVMILLLWLYLSNLVLLTGVCLNASLILQRKKGR